MAIKISGTTVIDNSQNITNAGIITATSFTGDGSQLTNLPGGGGNTLEATASGTLADGSKVIVNADGTVSVVTQTETTGPGAGTAEVFASVSTNAARSATYDSTNNKVVVAYQDGAASDHGKAVVGTVNTSTNEIAFGSPVTFASNGKTDKIAATFDSTNSRVVIAYEDAGNSSYGTAVVGQVSGTSITFGTPVVYEYATTTGGDVDTAITFDSTNGKVVIAYRDAGNSSYGTAIVGNVNPSTNSITFGSPTVFYQGNTQYISATFDSSNGRVVIAYSNRQSGQAYQGEAIVGTVSGTGNSISFPNSAFEFNSARTDYITTTFDASKNRVVIGFVDFTSSPSGYGTAIVGNVNPSNNSITYGSKVDFNTAGSAFGSAVYDASNNNIVIAYKDSGNSNYGTAIIGTVDPSNNSISFGSSVVFESAGTYWTSATYDSSNQKVVISYLDNGNSNYGTAAVFSQTGYGSVHQLSSPTLFESSNTYEPRAIYDSTNQRVVIVYRNSGNSGYGTAVVGTVSDTGISFGTPTVFNSASTVYHVAEYDPVNSLVLIAYQDGNNSDHGTIIMATVDPTDNSIAFSSEFVFNANTTHDIGLAYDSTNSKLVVAYDDASNYGYGKVKIGTVDSSNNSITFGSEVIFSGVGSNANDYIDAVYDSTNQRVVIVYRDHSNSYAATAIVGEVDGGNNTISFGAKNAFATTPQLHLRITYDSTNGKVVTSGDKKLYVGTVNASNNTIAFGSVVNLPASGDAGRGGIAYDSDAQKVIISYRDYSNSNYGTIISGTVSGTSITLDSPIVFETSETNDAATVYDSSSRKTVVAYKDSGNSNYGTAVTFSPRTISRNLTAENFIGISDGAYSDGQTATIQLTGAVDDAQSSLTPGQSYYVQNDGTLSETADNPSVFAGTALASTKLIVRG